MDGGAACGGGGWIRLGSGRSPGIKREPQTEELGASRENEGESIGGGEEKGTPSGAPFSHLDRLKMEAGRREHKR